MSGDGMNWRYLAKNLPSPLVGDEGVNNQALSGSFSDNGGKQ
jgi:hypothetical protein